MATKKPRKTQRRRRRKKKEDGPRACGWSGCKKGPDGGPGIIPADARADKKFCTPSCGVQNSKHGKRNKKKRGGNK